MSSSFFTNLDIEGLFLGGQITEIRDAKASAFSSCSEISFSRRGSPSSNGSSGSMIAVGDHSDQVEAQDGGHTKEGLMGRARVAEL